MPAQDAGVLPFGTAAIKALVLGKFILIGQAVGVGTRVGTRHLLHKIVVKSLAFLVMLMAFTLLEDLIVGWVHGQGFAETLSEHFSQTWIQLLAPDLLMLMVLVPLIAVSEINYVMGPGGLKGVLLKKHD